MLSFAAATLVLLAFLASLVGWGRAVAARVHPGTPLPAPYLAALGVGTWVLLGGVLNTLHLAFLPVLDAIAGVGLALAALYLRRALKARGAWPPGRLPAALRARLRDFGPRGLAGWAPALAMWGVTGFVAAELLPTAIFNHHDDLQKYFVPPFRMLATGTVGGDPFDTVGLFHLGPQSFLQAFVVGHFPAAWFNAFDAVFCFLLAGLLVDALGRRAGAGPVARLGAVAVYVAINPQLVNISPVYSASLTIAALLFASVLLREALEAPGTGPAARAALPVGAFLAVLVALKATYVPFAVLDGVALLAVLLATGAGLKRTGVALAAGAAGGLAVLAPWAIASGKDYLAVLVRFADRAARNAAHHVVAAPGAGAPPEALRDIGDLFSGQPTYFGHTVLDYALLATLLAVAGLALAWRLARSPGARARGFAGAALAAALAAVGYFLAIPYVFPLGQGVRYLSPVLLVALPVAGLALGGVPGEARAPALARRAALAAGVVTVLAVFGQGAWGRAVEARGKHTLVAFSVGLSNERMGIYAFSRPAWAVVREAQAHTRPGAGILTWVATPYLLDFARNPVLTIPDPDFSHTWAGIPFDDGPEGLRAYLLAHGVRYVMWDYGGPGMRTDAELEADIRHGGYAFRGRLTLQFKALLKGLMREDRVVHDDGFLAVIDLDPEAG